VLIFVGGISITAIDGIVWFETGRLPTWQRVFGTESPIGAVMGVTGVLVVHRSGGRENQTGRIVRHDTAMFGRRHHLGRHGVVGGRAPA
jgi:hypothetical protein